MPLSAPEYWLEWAKNYFRCQFTYVGELIHKETWSSASFGWAEGLQTINPPIYRLTTAVSDIDQTNINRDIRDVYTRPFFTLKNHFENWTFHCTLHFALLALQKKTTLSVGGGWLQKNWAVQFLLSHQLTQAFSGESETAPMILNSFQTFLYYAYLSRKTQCSGRLLEHRGRKSYNFLTFYVISNDVFRLLATFWTSQSTHGTDS